MRVVIALCVASLSAAAQNPTPAQVDASRAAQVRGSQGARMRESRTAMQVINGAQDARTALSRNDSKSALQSIDRALNASRELDKLRGSPGKIPVYSEVVRVSVHAPSSVAEKGTGTADRSRPQPVQGVASEYTNVYLDITGTTRHLDEARAALQRGDAKAADNALAAVQSAVTSESVSINLPLVRSRENLILAAEQARAGDFTAAQVTLAAAVQGLEEYANGVGPAHGPEARALGREIVLYAQRLQSEHDGAPGRIETWWDRIASWSEPTVSKGGR